MTKRIHKEELLYEINDRGKIKLGTNLHRPNIGFTEYGERINWSVESLLMAEELAQVDGVDFPMFDDCLASWEYSYYCKINGMRYKITQKKKAMYGKIYHKIELV
jgi:hypothetical protein